MRDWITEAQGEYKSHKWMIKFILPYGYRCGYVEVPESLNKFKSRLEDLDVHGGVTYIEHFNPLDYKRTPNFWIGFDCFHAGDGLTFPPEELEEFYQRFEVRSQEYCVEECKRLIDQLIELESKVKEE